MSTIRTALRTFKKRDWIWRYVSNLRPTVSYVANSRESLTIAEKQVLTQLNNDGIAVTTIDAVLNDSEFRKLEQSLNHLLEDKTAEIAQLRLNAANDSEIGGKTFNLEMLGSELSFEADNPFAIFALNSNLLNIANNYLRMTAKLRYFNVWLTAASNSRARESQLWHRDREDNYILKVFLYLDDVDEETGPFTYAPGTHKKGRYWSIKPAHFSEGNVHRTTDAQMEAVYPRENWKVCTGKKGTIIFADTRGFHKGGEARTRDRLMYNAMYTSPASESRSLIRFPENLHQQQLSEKQLAAIRY